MGHERDIGKGPDDLEGRNETSPPDESSFSDNKTNQSNPQSENEAFDPQIFDQSIPPQNETGTYEDPQDPPPSILTQDVKSSRKKTGYWTIEKIEEELRRVIEEGGSLSYTDLIRGGNSILLSGITSKYPGGMKALQERLGVQTNRKSRDYWNQESIDEEAKRIIDQFGDLSRPLLDKLGKKGFGQVISTKYPGGIRALQEKYGIKTKRVPLDYWTPEKIQNEAREFLAQHGNLSRYLLRQEGRSPLLYAISSAYPGGINGLKEYLGVKSQKSSGYWTSQQIEADVRQFVEENGGFNASLLKERGRGDLLGVIQARYAGGMRALQDKYGVEAQRKPKGFWTIKTIEEEAKRIFTSNNNTFSKALLEELGEYGLINAIYNNYPGKIRGLRRDLGIADDIDSESELKISLTQSLPELMKGEEGSPTSTIKLIHLFGESNAVDVLFRTHPEYKGLPVEYVKSRLSEYLGDFLVTKAPFNLNDLQETVPHLSDTTLQEGLIDVIKEQCLSYYNQRRKEGTEMPAFEIISEYLASLEGEISSLDSEELNAVGREVREYYQSLFTDFVRPQQFVPELKEGRLFPDINQLINMKELSDKKKLLIADKMGLGKSASAILAKETFGVSQALVVAPSDVISTWQKYLSDQEGGYFREGQAPQVLIIENIKDIKGQDTSGYEYVLVSQEKLTDHNTQTLQELNFDMLIVDEVHKLKNIRYGIWSKNLLSLAQKIEGDDKYLALLSGTPVPNKIEDLAMILKLLYPDRFSSMPNRELVRNIIKGDLIDLRSLLLPRMQMKDLKESIDMPQLNEVIIDDIELSDLEKQVYEVLLEEDELEVTEKMKILRQFLLNPSMLDATPNLPSAKIDALERQLNKTFQDKERVVVFVNGYVEGVIRGDNTILDQLNLPDDVTIHVIEGNVPIRERERIQSELANGTGRILFVVSGQTADVGVDFSNAQAVDFYNEPWTQFDKDQQLSRVYREGLEDDLTSSTFIVRGTIEEGIHQYIQTKYKAINKLLHGIPISQLEQDLLQRAEQQVDPDLEVNPELARFYLSSAHKMLRLFSQVREIGEQDFKKFLLDYGEMYAQGYEDMGRRSYQANASRIAATLIDKFTQEQEREMQDIKILDLASGPEMLRTHSPEQYGDNIISLDINSHHFTDKEGGDRVIGSFSHLPFTDQSVDYINLSLAWHYSKFSPRNNNFERLEVLTEASRVLKNNGRVILNNIYSLGIRNEEMFREIMELIGFKVVQEYTGEVDMGKNYKSNLITLEKVRDIDTDVATILQTIGSENFDGLRFSKVKTALRDSRKILQRFEINGSNIPINLNPEDQIVLEEEEAILAEGDEMKLQFGSIQEIPREKIIDRGFIRIRSGNNYILFKKLETSNGIVTIK
ncbi:MAG: methyltransferase domain-containing protein [Candidatus Levybacteria bacterium]|nr:methyltransferase domain-containing protein [Candidatus Levybacteria bacterium]